jgi:hypothetical protein
MTPPRSAFGEKYLPMNQDELTDAMQTRCVRF